MLRPDRLLPSSDPATSRRRLHLFAAVVLAVGLLFRLYYYLGDPSIWFDEGVIIVNVETKGYAELLGPLKEAPTARPCSCGWKRRW
jgi:hypothetical protein